MLNIKKASDPIGQLTIRELIYGEPGIGKTTLALTAPSPLLIDCDAGVRRVEAKFRTDYVPVEKWADIAELFNSPSELKQYETIIVDTVGKLLEFLSTKIISENFKMGRGGSLTLQGYGQLLTEFRTFLHQVSQMGKNIIFIAHDREFQDGERTKLRPDIIGRSLGSILREMDLVGYMQSRNGERTISFTPSDTYYGKNTCQLEDVMPIADLNKSTVKPMTDIFKRYHENQSKQVEILDSYNVLISVIDAKIASIEDAETATEIAKELKTLEEIWDSKTIARLKLNEKVGELNLKWNKTKESFENDKELKG